MKFIHFLNAILWFANSVCWAFYAHVPVLAAGSLAVAATTAYLGWSDQ